MMTANEKVSPFLKKVPRYNSNYKEYFGTTHLQVHLLGFAL
jgi:hypothetical protein